jgi:hypothetical protein
MKTIAIFVLIRAEKSDCVFFKHRKPEQMFCQCLLVNDFYKSKQNAKIVLKLKNPNLFCIYLCVGKKFCQLEIHSTIICLLHLFT